MKTPYEPGTLPVQRPYAFWLAAALDNHSRAVVGFKVFDHAPSGEEVCNVLDVAVGVAGRAPGNIISDQGPQLQEDFLEWCHRRGVKQRYGAIREHGSIVVIERFWRSLKDEMWRRLSIVTPSRDWIQEEVRLCIQWYHQHRPHQGLRGRTPADVRDGRPPDHSAPPIETRAAYPLQRPEPWKRARRVNQVELSVEHVEGRAHLPIVCLRAAA